MPINFIVIYCYKRFLKMSLGIWNAKWRNLFPFIDPTHLQTMNFVLSKKLLFRGIQKIEWQMKEDPKSYNTLTHDWFLFFFRYNIFSPTKTETIKKSSVYISHNMSCIHVYLSLSLVRIYCETIFMIGKTLRLKKVKLSRKQSRNFT